MNESQPLFSIVTPTLNSERFLEETIESIINQTYPNIEYIIVDGGSSDKTLKIVEKYKHRISHLISEKDKGMYDAINKGIDVSKGEYFTYLNSDDCMYKDTISKVVRYFRDNEHIEFLYGAMDFIDSNSNYLFKRNYPRRDWRDYAACDYSMIGQPSSFWRSSVFKKIGVFDSTFTMLGDADFYTRVLKSCKYKNSAESFSKFRLHSNALTLINKHKHHSEHNTMYSKYLNSEVPKYRSFINNIYFKMYNIHNYINQFLLKKK